MPASTGDFVEDVVSYAGEELTVLDEGKQKEGVELSGAPAKSPAATHQAAAAIDDMISAYGGMWPPRPTFSGWPASWRVLAQIADDMPQICHEMNDASKFREWMRDQLKEKVNIIQTTLDPVVRVFLPV